MVRNSILFLLFLSLSTVLAELVLYYQDFPPEHPFKASPQPNQNDTLVTTEFTSIIRTNSFGLRGAEPDSVKASHRVMFLGDSFVFGLGVEENESFCSLVSNHRIFKRKPVETLNAGLIGAGPLHYARYYLNEGYKLRPDLVLICVYANDLSNCEPVPVGEQLFYTDSIHRKGLKHLAHRLFPRLYIALANLAPTKKNIYEGIDARKLAVNALTEQHRDTAEFSTWLQSLPKNALQDIASGKLYMGAVGPGFAKPDEWITNLDQTNLGDEVRWKNYLNSLSAIIAKCRLEQTKVGIVYIPFRGQFDARFFNDPHPMILSGTKVNRNWLNNESQTEKKLMTWCSEMKIPFFNTTPHIMTAILQSGSLNHTYDHHFNVTGNSVTAAILSRWIATNPDLGYKIKRANGSLANVSN